MLPTGDYVSSTSTEELLTLANGMTNKTVSFVVTEVSEPKTSKNGFRYMQIFGVNDEEEPLKLNVWGAIATEKFNSIVKPGALYTFTGVKVSDSKPQFQYAHLPFDLQVYDWGNAELVRGDYKPKGLPLKQPNDIVPGKDWRIRCRGVVVQNFTRYMRYGSALTGTIRVGPDLHFEVTLRSVPMAYIDSFTKDTEVELVGHISRNGSVWDFDVMKWDDVRNSPSIARNNISAPASHSGPSPAERTPPTPQMTFTSKFDFGQSPAVHNHKPPVYRNGQQASKGSAGLQNEAGWQGTPPSTFIGFKIDVEGLVIQEPRWNDGGQCFNLLVSITHEGKPKVVSVVSSRLLADVANNLKRGSKVYLTGEVVNKRTGYSMDADEVIPEEIFLSKAKQTSLPTAFSTAEDICGGAVQWHKIHADIISEPTFDDETNAYNCFVIVHDSAVTIQLELCSVPTEAVPRLTMFAELILVGIISGDEDALKMCVSWEHVAFAVAQDTSTESLAAVDATETPGGNQALFRGSAEIQVVGEFSTSTATVQHHSTPHIPRVDLGKVKQEKMENDAATAPRSTSTTNKRKPAQNTGRASTRNSKLPKTGTETTIKAVQALLGNSDAPVPSIQATTSGEALPPASALVNSIDAEAADDDVAEKSCIE